MSDTSVQSEAFHRGMLEAVRILRDGARDADVQYAASTSVAERVGLLATSSILRSWANGIEIKADTRLRTAGEGAGS